MNKVILAGNVGANPTSHGTVVFLSVATTKRWRDKDSGEQKEKRQFHTVRCFGHKAEFVKKHVVKGQAVCIEAEIEETQRIVDGSKVYNTEIHLLELEFQGAKPKSGNGEQSGSEIPDDFDFKN